MIIIAFIIVILFLIALLTGMVWVKEGAKDNVFMYYLCMYTIISFIILASIKLGIGTGYKRGQVDALTGNVNYKLVTEQDSTRSWIEIKKE